MRRPGVWAWAGAVASLLLALVLFDPRIFVGGDNATYYALAKALATGRGYVDLVAPGAPPEAVYPPGYPLLLVPFYWLFGGSIVGLKVASWVAAAAALAGAWALARRDPAVPPWAAAGLVATLGLYPVFLDYAHWVLSDLPFVAVSLAALAAFARAARPDPGEEPAAPDRWTGWWAVGLALSLGAFWIRTAGLLLLGAAFLRAGLARRWRRAGATAAITVVGAGPWIVWSTIHAPATTGGYLAQLLASNPYDPTSPPLSAAELLGRIGHHLAYYGTAELPRLFWPATPPPTLAVAAALVGGLAVAAWGLWRALRARGPAVHDLYAALVLLLLLVWPWTGDRFFLTLVPILWIYLLVGLDGAARLLAGGPVAAVGLTAAVAAVLAVGAARKAPEQWPVTRAHMQGDELAGYDPYWADWFEAARWIGDNAPDAVIVSRKPGLAWLWSGRPSFLFPQRYDPSGTWAMIRERGATHVLLDEFASTGRYLAPALRDHVDEIETVHSAPGRDVYVLAIRPAS